MDEARQPHHARQIMHRRVGPERSGKCLLRSGKLAQRAVVG